MKCPCCGEQTDRDFIIVYNTVHRSDGTKLHCTPSALHLFTRLLHGPIPVPARRGSFDVSLSKLRRFLIDNSFSYGIQGTRTHYYLVSRTS